MNMKKIKNKKIAIGVLVVIAIIGGAGAFFPKSLQTPKASTYTDTDYGFSFSYPMAYTTSAFSDTEDTKTILLGSFASKSGTQIFISPFDEDIILTIERIKKEMPDLVVLEPQSLSVDGIPGVVFQSTNALNTESWEFWFVRKGNLYQVSTPTANKDLFDVIITKWQWSK